MSSSPIGDDATMRQLSGTRQLAGGRGSDHSWKRFRCHWEGLRGSWEGLRIRVSLRGFIGSWEGLRSSWMGFRGFAKLRVNFQ